MFGSTYRCEKLFADMKGNKSPVKSIFHNTHVGSDLKVIAATNILPEIGKFTKKKCQLSARKY